MAPRKKQYSGRGEKQRAYEQRLQEAGKRRICVWLDEPTIEKLAKLAEKGGMDRGEAIEALLRKK